MSDIIAEKNGKRRKFNSVTWGLLGPDNDGWKAMPDQLIEDLNSKKNIQKPRTGEKSEVPTKDQKIENVNHENPREAQEINNQSGGEENKKSEKTPTPLSEFNISEKKLEFEKAATGITRGAIKDFLDTREPAVQYDKTASKPELIDKLGEYLKYDVLEFQKMFS